MSNLFKLIMVMASMASITNLAFKAFKVSIIDLVFKFMVIIINLMVFINPLM